MELLAQIVEVCVIPLLGVLVSYFVSYINQKKKQIAEQTKNETLQKYVLMLGDTIVNCVLATKQTYVDNLKKEGMFTAEAQKEALEITYQAVLQTLSAEAQDYLKVAFGDVKTYILQKIEAEVALQKASGQK